VIAIWYYFPCWLLWNVQGHQYGFWLNRDGAAKVTSFFLVEGNPDEIPGFEAATRMRSREAKHLLETSSRI
jgi:hypothetical protein